MVSFGEEFEVDKIKFEDFMDEGLTGGAYRKKFADLFKADYDDMVKKKIFGKDDGANNYDDYVDYLVKQGEFDHKMNNPFPVDSENPHLFLLNWQSQIATWLS